METLNFKILSLLIETGSTMASEIRAEFGAKNPYRCISTLRKTGFPIRSRRIWGNERVYFLPQMFNIVTTDEEYNRKKTNQCAN